MPGSVRITAVNGISTVVDLHTVGGSPTQPNVFSDAALSQAVVLPVTITADTTFYVPTTGALTLSVKVGGTEVGPGEVFLTNAAPVGFALDTDVRNTDLGRLMELNGGSTQAAVAKITGELLLTGAQMVSDGSGLGGYQVVAADMTLTEIQGTSGVTIGDWPGDPTIGAVLLHEPGDYDYALYVSPTLTPNAGVTTLRSLGVGFAGGGVGNSAGLDATFPLPVNNLIQQTVRGQPAWSVPGSGLANSALQAPFFFLFDGSATDSLDISFILHVWKM